MRCRCPSPRPVPAAEDRFVTICGTLVWCSGIEYIACASCGLPITEPTARAAEPDDGDDTARVLSQSRP